MKLLFQTTLKYCEWNGLAIPCSAIFSTFPTERGMCCSFNMKAAEDIFLGETYSKLIQNLQQSDKNYSFERGQLPSKYFTNGELKTQPGTKRGLTVVLDAHTDLLSAGSVQIDDTGFLGLLQSSGSFPLATLGTFDIKPGHKNLVAITGTVVNSSKELYNLNSTARNCLFGTENDNLTLYRNYTQSNCLFECALNFAQTAMMEKYMQQPCIPWYFPTLDKNLKICNPWTALEFVKLMSNLPKDECQYCLPDCTVTIYKTFVTAVPLRICSLKSFMSVSICNVSNNADTTFTMLGDLVTGSYERKNGILPYFTKNAFKHSIRNLGQSLVNGHYFGPSESGYNAFEKDISIVQVYFKTATVVKMWRQPVMTWNDFFSNIGGILGLVLGIGMITLMELSWLIIQIGKETIFSQEQCLSKEEAKLKESVLPI